MTEPIRDGNQLRHVLRLYLPALTALVLKPAGAPDAAYWSHARELMRPVAG